MAALAFSRYAIIYGDPPVTSNRPSIQQTQIEIDRPVRDLALLPLPSPEPRLLPKSPRATATESKVTVANRPLRNRPPATAIGQKGYRAFLSGKCRPLLGPLRGQC